MLALGESMISVMIASMVRVMPLLGRCLVFCHPTARKTAPGCLLAVLLLLQIVHLRSVYEAFASATSAEPVLMVVVVFAAKMDSSVVVDTGTSASFSGSGAAMASCSFFTITAFAWSQRACPFSH